MYTMRDGAGVVVGGALLQPSKDSLIIAIICDAKFHSEESMRAEDMAGLGEDLLAGLQECERIGFVFVFAFRRQLVMEGSVFCKPDWVFCC